MSLMPLALLVVERLFAVLAVPERLVGCDLAHVEPWVGAKRGGVEDDVDLFERSVASLRVEEVYERDGDGVAVRSSVIYI